MCMFLSSGLPDPNKSVFVRHSSTVVCTAGIPNSLAVEPRDEFNNLCIFRPDENPTEGYNVAITQIGNPEPVECSVMLDYEEASHRINLQMQFPSEGCFHATVSYRGIELHNGDFDIIVLSASDAALVQKNVASKNHNICYEARLVGMQGERLSKPKKKCFVMFHQNSSLSRSSCSSSYQRDLSHSDCALPQSSTSIAAAITTTSTITRHSSWMMAVNLKWSS